MSTENAETTYYIYGLGLIAEEKADTYKTYHYDYRGSTTAITDTNGNVTGRVYYDVYGSIITRTGTTNTSFLYIGKYGVETDDSGLYYMRARYYNPMIQRFVNVDPIRDGLNWYGYAGGNSINDIDPTGCNPLESLKNSAQDAYNDFINHPVVKDINSIWNDKTGRNHLLKTGAKVIVVNYVANKLIESDDTSKLADTLITLKAVQYTGDSVINEFKYQTQRGNLDNTIDATIGAYPDSNGVYHIRQNYWQSIPEVGYNDSYDFVFEGAVDNTGYSATERKFKFNHNGQELILWGWKGDYINLGAGGELGIYSKTPYHIGGHYHYTTATQYAMPMTIKVTRKIDGKQILYWDSRTATNPIDQNQWWITGFNPQYQNVQADELDVVITMDCTNNSNLYNSIQNQYNLNIKNNIKNQYNMKFTGNSIIVGY